MFIEGYILKNKKENALLCIMPYIIYVKKEKRIKKI